MLRVEGPPAPDAVPTSTNLNSRGIRIKVRTSSKEFENRYIRLLYKKKKGLLGIRPGRKIKLEGANSNIGHSGDALLAYLILFCCCGLALSSSEVLNCCRRVAVGEQSLQKSHRKEKLKLQNWDGWRPFPSYEAVMSATYPERIFETVF